MMDTTHGFWWVLGFTIFMFIALIFVVVALFKEKEGAQLREEQRTFDPWELQESLPRQEFRRLWEEAFCSKAKKDLPNLEEFLEQELSARREKMKVLVENGMDKNSREYSQMNHNNERYWNTKWILSLKGKEWL